MTESRSESAEGLARACEEACRQILGVREAVALPPSPLPPPHARRQQNSVRVSLGDRTVIATRRRDIKRAHLEANVLVALDRGGAPVPRLLARNGIWLIQEDMGRTRLSQALAGASEPEGEAILDRALAALVACQEAGAKAGLAPRVGDITGYRKLLSAPGFVATVTGVPLPKVAAAPILAIMREAAHGFVKWDARPGNAIMDGGRVVWIDWEECGRRCRPDDLIWLLCDEWVPDWPAAEERLLAKYGPAFPIAWPSGNGSATDYLAVAGALHMILRLEFLLRSKQQGPWWDPRICLEHDLIGVTRGTVDRLTRRAARWGARSQLSAPFVPWLEAVASRVPE